MKVYLVYSESYRSILDQIQANVLVNFATLNKFPNGFKDIIIDSGGYQLQMGTHSKLSAPMIPVLNEDTKHLIKDKWIWVRKPTPDAYSRWLLEVLPDHPEVKGYFNLDILGDGLATLQNQFRMESYGLRPIPVWHLGEDEEFLQYYYTHYDYIAVGGLISGSTSKKVLKQLTSLLAQKYPNMRYHYFGIGITGASVFQEMTPYSCDFSTWSNPARYGFGIKEDPKQIVKEYQLSKELRDRIRVDRKALDEELLKGAKLLVDLETKIESIRSNEKQIIMF